MGYIIGAIIVLALVFNIFLMTSCWGIPAVEAPAQCLMLIGK